MNLREPAKPEKVRAPAQRRERAGRRGVAPASTAAALLCATVLLARGAAAAEDPVASFTRGESLYRRGRYSQAGEAFRQTVAADPSFKAAYYYLGEIYRRNRKWTEAADAYGKFVALANSRAASERKPLEYSLRQLVVIQFRLKRYEDAYTAAHKVWELTGAASDCGGVGLVRLAEAAGRLDDLLSEARQAVKTTPADPEAYRLLWQAQERAGQKDEALATLRRAVENCPGRGFHRLLATAYASRQDFKTAAQEYRAALAEQPGSWATYEALARTLVKLHDDRGALAAIERAVELARSPGPGGAAAVERLTVFRDKIRARAMTPAELVRQCAEQVEKAPKDPAARRRYADALERAGRRDEALSQHLAAVELDGDWSAVDRYEGRLRVDGRAAVLTRLLLEKLVRAGPADNWRGRNTTVRFLHDLRTGTLDETAVQAIEAFQRDHPRCVALRALRLRAAEVLEELDAQKKKAGGTAGNPRAEGIEIRRSPTAARRREKPGSEASPPSVQRRAFSIRPAVAGVSPTAPLQVEAVTRLIPEDRVDRPGFQVRQRQEFHIRLGQGMGRVAELSVAGIAVASASPEASLTAGSGETMVATWKPAASSGGGPGNNEYVVLGPTTVKRCPEATLSVKRDLTRLADGRFRCTITATAPLPTVIRLRRPALAVIDETSFQPTPTKEKTRWYCYGGRPGTGDGVDCRQGFTFSFTVRPRGRRYLPQLELSWTESVRPELSCPAKGEWNLLIDDAALHLVGPQSLTKRQVVVQRTVRLVIPEVIAF